MNKTLKQWHSFSEWGNRLDQYAPAHTHADASLFRERQAARQREAYAARERKTKEANEAELRG